MTAVYSIEQIRQLEHAAMTVAGLSETTLMARAGLAAWRQLCAYWPNAQSLWVCCGAGNNAGDGYVLARLAHEAGLTVWVTYLSPPDQLPPAAKAAAEACQACQIPLFPWMENGEKFLQSVTQSSIDVIVDAVLGIGIQGEVRAPARSCIQAMNRHVAPVLALDIPSGLDADQGAVADPAVVTYAAVTVTFIGYKLGCYTGIGPNVCGVMVCDALGIPSTHYDTITPPAAMIEPWGVLRRRCLLPRRGDTHKGHYGHVLVVGGDHGMAGAVAMAARAALRVGAGLVSVATRSAHQSVVCDETPEIMCHGVETPTALDPLLKKATTVILGPGLGRSAWSKTLFNRVCEHRLTQDPPCPLLLDADGLFWLSQEPLQDSRWVLTPHVGEAARLLACSSDEVDAERVSVVTRLQAKYDGVVVLKGQGTLVSAGSEQSLFISTTGNPGLATAGMGDILSGVIGGLLAQGVTLKDAACLGVTVHGRAGDRMAQQIGQCGLVAPDLLMAIAQQLP